jgi:hypothetical protein
VLIENIEYLDYNEIKTTVIAKMIIKFNPNSKFYFSTCSNRFKFYFKIGFIVDFNNASFEEMRKDEGNFKKQVLIENIEYIDYNEIKTTVIAKMLVCSAKTEFNMGYFSACSNRFKFYFKIGFIVDFNNASLQRNKNNSNSKND